MKKQKIAIILLSVIAVVAIVFAAVLFYQKRQNDLEQQMIQEKINEVQTMLVQFHNETNQIEQLVIMETTKYMSEVNSQYGVEVTLAYDSALLEMNIVFSDYIEDLIASYTFEDLSTKEKEKLNEAIENLNSIKVLGIYEKVNNEEKSYDEQIDSLIDSYQTRIAEIEKEQEAEKAEEEARIAEEETRIAEEEAANARIAREAEYENKIEANKMAEGTDDISIYSAVIETYNNLLAEILADKVISSGARETLSGKINTLIAQYDSEQYALINIARMNAMAVSP